MHNYQSHNNPASSLFDNPSPIPCEDGLYADRNGDLWIVSKDLLRSVREDDEWRTDGRIVSRLDHDTLASLSPFHRIPLPADV